MKNADLEKDFLPVYCEKCKQQGFIFLENMDEPAFIVCSRCGSEMSQVSCPNCKMGGDYVEKIGTRPTSWICSSCKIETILPTLFYEKPIHLYLREELPPEVLSRVLPPVNPVLKWSLRMMGVVGIGEIALLIFLFNFINKPLLPACLSIIVMFSLLIILGRWATKFSQRIPLKKEK